MVTGLLISCNAVLRKLMKRFTTKIQQIIDYQSFVNYVNEC
ncbi:MAG: hypothetical protein JWR23_2315 [Mucilaginibacter sp.]|nr:hypothetical protein [Mucilaginibacter sp.]